MFVLPNDKLSVYKDVINRGIFDFNDNLTHHVEVEVTDIHNNKSSLTFKVKPDNIRAPEAVAATNKNLKIMPYNKTNRFVADNISISIPGGALYDTLFFDYEKTPGTKDMLS